MSRQLLQQLTVWMLRGSSRPPELPKKLLTYISRYCCLTHDCMEASLCSLLSSSVTNFLAENMLFRHYSLCCYLSLLI